MRIRPGFWNNAGCEFPPDKRDLAWHDMRLGYETMRLFKGTRPQSLNTFVRRILILRLVLTGVLMSIILGAGTFFTIRRYIGQEVVQHALNQVALFDAETDHLIDNLDSIDPDTMQAALDEFNKRPARWTRGTFVFSRFYDRKMNTLAHARTPEYPLIERVDEYARKRKMPVVTPGAPSHQPFLLARRPHIWITVPLHDRRGELMGHADGVFALSNVTIKEANYRVARTVGAVIVIVLAATGILYPVIIGLTRRLSRFSTDLLDSNLEILKVLGSAVAKRDSGTSAHNQRVTIMAVRLAEAVGMEPQAIQTLMKGAFLHDVGKIGIHDAILLKPGRLTDDEFRIMKSHVNHGYDIVERSAWLRDACDVVRFHHEKVDGTGYPMGLKGSQIPIGARIFALADVFDALTSRRPYKEKMSLDGTLNTLNEGRGTHFDTNLLDAFVTLAEDFYRDLAGREDEGLQDHLQELIDRYFKIGDEALVY